MRTRIIEVTNGPNNWGKFLIGQFTAEDHALPSAIFTGSKTPLLRQIGWDDDGSTALVLDLQTGEGAIFRLGGLARADLNKHKIWVCPLCEPFLEWLYEYWRVCRRADDVWWDGLPALVDLPDAPFALSGYRREGRDGG